MNSISRPMKPEVMQRGEPILPQSPENGYDQNWYPICYSSEVEPDKIYGTEFMNGRVIVIRDADGKAHVMSAYCRHLGADLSDGEVIGGTVRCPYHHWRFDAQGTCVATAVKDKPPANAKLFHFPTAEAFGFVWAFNGTEPLYEVPHFPIPEEGLEYRTEFNVLTHQDHFIPYSNSSDIQHLMAVHKINLEVNPEDVEIFPHRMHYFQTMDVPGIGKLRQEVFVFGTNCVIFMSQFLGRPVLNMSSGKALPGHRTLHTMITATPKGTGQPGEAEQIDLALSEGMRFGNQLFNEDMTIMKHLKFRRDLLTHSDRMLARYLDYVRAYPRTSIACDMIA